MSGTAISLPRVTAAVPLLPPLPNIAGAVLWTYFGGSLALSQNQGSGGAFANYGPGPTWQPNYGHFLGANGGLSTPAVTPKAMTLLAVARPPGGGTTGAVAALFYNTGAGIIQCSLTPGASPVFNLTNQLYGSGTLTLPLPSNATANFKFLAATSGGNAPQMLYNETDAAQSTTGTTGNPAADGTATHFVGVSNSGTTNDRPIDIAFIALYNSVVSKANIDLIYAHVKAALLLRPGTPINI